jgi:hypothetical protein
MDLRSNNPSYQQQEHTEVYTQTSGTSPQAVMGS